MRIKSYVCILLFSTFLKDGHAATIQFNEELLPLQVNNDVIEHSLFSKVTELELAPGQYALKLQYSDLYELDYDEHEVVDSDAFWIELNITEQGVYQVTFERAEDVDAAKIFAKNPVVRIVTPHAKTQLAVKLNGLAQSSMIAAMPAQHSHDKKSAASTQPQPKARLTTPSLGSQKPVQGVSHPDAATMLDFWWQQASSGQRAAFLEKIKKGQ
ncbi:DUF2057 family protein [Pseudoalteromonas aurantia]|uniref:DUF2057 domain-containing protein n=1 Tax=Pseudoalteromonas aurantia 208 TaxID=1314867 RepID=A0ABR9EFS7_9GAMM|nr:DUF2057 family protein [Pseudoalteromonas aurantia]MBE0369865.1 hypothetical protein [Pseudoalteromonas aurantia 208]